MQTRCVNPPHTVSRAEARAGLQNYVRTFTNIFCLPLMLACPASYAIHSRPAATQTPPVAARPAQTPKRFLRLRWRRHSPPHQRPRPTKSLPARSPERSAPAQRTCPHRSRSERPRNHERAKAAGAASAPVASIRRASDSSARNPQNHRASTARHDRTAHSRYPDHQNRAAPGTTNHEHVGRKPDSTSTISTSISRFHESRSANQARRLGSARRRNPIRLRRA